MTNNTIKKLSKLKIKEEFEKFFGPIDDSRVDGRKSYPLLEILFCALCASIGNINSCFSFEIFGKAKLKVLRKFLPYKNGIASDDTFRRLFQAIDPQKFAEKFELWIMYILRKHVMTSHNVIAIDGKTSRGSKDSENKAVHTISAFSANQNITLAQRKVDGKSNEIIAIPLLLETLQVEGAIVTIDAMGAQYKIADKICEKSGNYIFSLKGNQETLHQDVQAYFENFANKDGIETFKTEEKNRGRFEVRECTIITNPEIIKNLVHSRKNWKTIKSIIKIKSERTHNQKLSTETRYYISSLACTAEVALSSIRSHWAIENSLHYILDVTFGDDKNMTKESNAVANMLIIKKMALNLLQIIKTKFPTIDRIKTTIASVRLRAALSDDWLLAVLRGDYESSTG